MASIVNVSSGFTPYVSFRIVVSDSFHLSMLFTDVLGFSCASDISNDQLQQNKRQVVADVIRSAEEVKYGNIPWALDAQFADSQCSGGLRFPDKPCSVKLCSCNSFHGSRDLITLDSVEDLGPGENKILDSGRKAFEDDGVCTEDNVKMCSVRRATQQPCLQRPVRPKSLEVTHDTRVHIESHHYENLARVFRVATRASSGDCLDIRESKNNDDAESENSSLATAATPVGRIVSSSSVDTAIGRTMCKCNDIDLMSYQLAHNSIELESAAARNPAGVSSTSSEQCFHESRGARMIGNYTSHCSRPSGEVSLLNEDLMKYAQRNPRSVSMPVDIVSVRPLPPDQRIGNSLASGVNTASQGQQPLQPISSGSSMPLPVETKALRKRAYRVGLNLFNR